MDGPSLLDGRFNDIEGAGGIQQRRRHAEHLQDDADTEKEDGMLPVHGQVT